MADGTFDKYQSVGSAGKLRFDWKDAVIDGRGVRTVGIVSPETRTSQVSIEGSATITAKLPVHTERATYGLTTWDLRGELATRWRIDEAPTGRDSRQELAFKSPLSAADPAKIYRRSQADVRDEDDLTATQELRAEFDVIVPESQQPF